MSRRVHPAAILAVLFAGIVLVLMAIQKGSRKPRASSILTNEDLPQGIEAAMKAEDGDIHVKDWRAWMKIAPQAVEASMKETGTDPVALVTNVFRRLFPDKPWPPPPDSEFSDKWDAIVRAIAIAVGRPLPANLEVIR